VIPGGPVCSSSTNRSPGTPFSRVSYTLSRNETKDREIAWGAGGYPSSVTILTTLMCDLSDYPTPSKVSTDIGIIDILKVESRDGITERAT
jgi:hypothetical protein